MIYKCTFVLEIKFILKPYKKIMNANLIFFSAIMTISYMQSEVCQSILLPCLVYQLFYVHFMKVIIFPILK